MPFSSIPAELESAKAEWAKLNKEKQALFKAREDALQNADKEAAAAEMERKDAVVKRSSALKTKSDEEAAASARDIVAAKQLIDAAEASLEAGGKAASLEVLTAGESCIQWGAEVMHRENTHIHACHMLCIFRAARCRRMMRTRHVPDAHPAGVDRGRQRSQPSTS